MGKAKKKNTLTSKDLDKFKKLLLEKRAQLLGNITCMEDGTIRKDQPDLSKSPVHAEDLGTDNYDQEFTLGLVGSELKLLREINAALQRITDGTYGICEGNKEPIPEARLSAIPWTRHCVACATILEKGLTLSGEKRSEYSNYNYDDNDEDVSNDDDYYSEKAIK